MAGLFDSAGFEEVEATLRQAAEAAYGAERAAELAEDIRSVAKAIDRVSHLGLSYEESPPNLS